MQTSAVIFNTKPLLLGPPAQLKPISSTDSSSPLFSGHKHNWIHRTRAISIRTHRYPRSRAYLTISKVIASCIVLVFLFLIFFKYFLIFFIFFKTISFWFVLSCVLNGIMI